MLKESDYSGLFPFRLTLVSGAGEMQLVGRSQSRIRRSSHPFELQTERRGSFCVRGELSCGREKCNEFGEEQAKQDVRGISKRNDNEATKKFDGSTTRSTNPAEAPDWENSDVSILQDQVQLIHFTSFWCVKRTAQTLTVVYLLVLFWKKQEENCSYSVSTCFQSTCVELIARRGEIYY